MSTGIYKLPTLHCKRCGYKWIPRTLNVIICPSCKSPYWNIQKGEKGNTRRSWKEMWNKDTF